MLEVLFGKRAVRSPISSRACSEPRDALAGTTSIAQVMYTAALLHGNASPVDLEGSGFSQKRARNVIQLANELPRFTDALSETTSDHQRFRLFKHAIAGDAEHRRRRGSGRAAERGAAFRSSSRSSFPLRGNDLEVPLGPHVAKALERTREAVFTGEIAQAEAKTFAREMAIKYLDSQWSVDQWISGQEETSSR